MLSKLFKILVFSLVVFSRPLLAYSHEDFADLWIAKTTELKNQDYEEREKYRAIFKQWFLGPLLVPSPTSTPPGVVALEPTVTYLNTYGTFNNKWQIHKNALNMSSVQYTGYGSFGIIKNLGVDIITTVTLNYNKQSSAAYFQDTTLRIGYQVFSDLKEPGNWTPDLRIIYQQIFPTGKFQRLNPDKGGIDITGQGSYQSGVYIATEKGFKYHTNHAYNLYTAIGYIIPTNFNVHRQNLYGGNNFTKGKVHPGNVLSVYVSGEFELTKRIAVAFDSNYQQNFRGRFVGNVGQGATMNVPQTVFFQLAFPEIEITLGEKVGIITGPWFTIMGQNTPAFAAYFVTALIVF